MVVCLERDADLHMAHLMPLPLTVSCSSKIQISFTFLVPVHLDSHGQRVVKRVCVCVRVVTEVSQSPAGNGLGFPSPLWTQASMRGRAFGLQKACAISVDYLDNSGAAN